MLDKNFQRIDIENTSAHEICKLIDALDKDLILSLAEISLTNIISNIGSIKINQNYITTQVKNQIMKLDTPRGLTFAQVFSIYSKLFNKVSKVVENEIYERSIKSMIKEIYERSI